MTHNTQTENPSLASSNAKVLVVDSKVFDLDWGAVIGGIVFASAISFVLLTFGSGLGLAFASVSAKSYAVGAGIGAAIWFLWVEVSSFVAGAYLTGRLRRSSKNSTEHETEVRDGSHGLLVWAGCIIVGAFLALAGAGTLVNTAGTVAKSAGEVTASTAPAAMQYYADRMLRPGTAAVTSTPANDRAAVTTEIATILGRSAMASPTDEDKAYLAQLVAKQTGATPDEVKIRVDQAYANIDKAKADVAQAADTARRVSLVAAFLLAASLMVSAAAAFWAATLGGRHKDESVEFSGFFNRV